MLELHPSETALRPATTIVILVLLLLIAVAGIIFVVQLFAS
jgi:hypothetical protein